MWANITQSTNGTVIRTEHDYRLIKERSCHGFLGEFA